MAAESPESITPLAEISQGPSRFEQFLDQNQKSLIALTVLLVLGTIAWVVYSGIERSHEKTAGAALTKAEDIASLQAIVTDQADTRAAGSAMILLAERQWNDGKKDAAVATLREFISKNPEHPAHASGLASLGSKLMAQGNAADASNVFQQIISDPEARFIAPYALIAMGDLALTGGDIDKAENHYKRVKTDFPESGFLDTANRRIESLRAKAPLEITPPPAPAADKTPPASGDQPASEKPAGSVPEAPAAKTPEP